MSAFITNAETDQCDGEVRAIDEQGLIGVMRRACYISGKNAIIRSYLLIGAISAQISGCVTSDPIVPKPPRRGLGCTEVALLTSPDAFNRFVEYGDEADRLGGQLETLDSNGEEEAKAKADKLGEALGLILGNLFVLSNCHEQLSITQECHEFLRDTADLFEDR